jgi:hypothetical protein
MKFVYVLTSSEEDYYYEQFFLSLTSMHLYNPDAEIIVLIDIKTKKGLIDKRSKFEKNVSEIKIITVPAGFTQKEASRWIKTSIRNYIDGDFLFIDCDTIVTSYLDLSSMEHIKIGAVLDTHVSLSSHHLKNMFIKQKETSGFTHQFDFINYFNSGIIYCKDTPDTYNFFNLWHKLWSESNRHGIPVDQPSFNQANCETLNIISELPGEWNCQISHNGLNFLYNAKIIHYYATSLTNLAHPYKLASAEVLSSIKETGEIHQEITKLLHNPLAAFEENTRIVSEKYILDVFDSPMFKLLVWLRDCHILLYKMLNGTLRFLVTLLKKNPGYEKRRLRSNK